MTKVNLNQQVRVSLSPYGVEAYKRFYSVDGGYQSGGPIQDEDGRYTMQLHELMRVYGTELPIGLGINYELFPFSSLDIEIVEPS